MGNANSRHAQLDAFDFPPSLENLYLTETMSVQTKYYAFFCVFVSSA
jgi:hypothetical protein